MFLAILLAFILLGLPFIGGVLKDGLWYFLLSLGLVFLYSILFSVLKLYSYEFEYNFKIYFPFEVFLTIILLVPIICSTYFYFFDRSNSKLNQESFYDEKLFSRYGYFVRREIVPIGVKKNEVNKNLINEFYEHIKNDLLEKFSTDNFFNIEERNVSDLSTKSDSRYFIKLSFQTVRGSVFFYFFTISMIGNQMAFNSLQYAKSNHKWYHGLHYIVSAPFHYWSWIYHAVMKNYSVSSYLGWRLTDNSFDLMDIEGYIKTANFTIMRSIETFAEKHGLLTEELQQLIVNNINNTQNIKVEKSKRVRFGKMRVNFNSKNT